MAHTSMTTAPPGLGKRPRCADPTVTDYQGGWKRRSAPTSCLKGEELASSGSPATPASFTSIPPALPSAADWQGAAAPVVPLPAECPPAECLPRPVAAAAAAAAAVPPPQDRLDAVAAGSGGDDDSDVAVWLETIGRRPAAADVRFIHALTSVIEDSCEVGPSVNDEDGGGDDGDDDASAFSDLTAAADAADDATEALVATFDATDAELARFPTPDDYVAHLARAGRVSTAALLMAWLYMGRARGHHPTTSVVSEMTLRRLLAASVRVAAKVLDEPVCSAAAWARVAGLDGGAAEVARCEVALLNLVHWGVHVSVSGYREMADLVCHGVGGMGAPEQA